MASFAPPDRGNSSTLSFTLNSKHIEIHNPDSRQTLLEYLRDTAKLTGTKRSCLQGGCGACLVFIERYDHVEKQWLAKPVNACLKPLASCDGAKITTVEGVGSERRGCHPVQERIAGNHGMQCGYCTPGFVMNTYALLKEHGSPTAQQVMDSFDGNICRCTGYRNIVNAAETFAQDASPECRALAEKFTPCNAAAQKLDQGQAPGPELQPKAFNVGPFTWHAPTKLSDLLDLKKQLGFKAAYILGDTAKGIRSSAYEVFNGKTQNALYLGHVSELNVEEEADGCLVLGSARRIQDIIRVLQHKKDKIVYAKDIIDALTTPAQRHVRSEAGWAGNLLISRTGFQSDLFPALLAADAKISFVVGDLNETTVPLEKLLPGSAGGPPSSALLTKLHIPLNNDKNTIYRYYRVAQRKWLAHAFVNAAFRVTVDPVSKRLSDARVALGVFAMGPKRSHKAEDVLNGSELNSGTLRRAIAAIHEEFDGEFMGESQYVTADNPKGKDEYRKTLPDSFLFKFFQEVQAAFGVKAWPAGELGCLGVGPARPLKKGTMIFQEHEGRANIPQLAAKSLATGEVKYTDDLPIAASHGYLVLTECATGNLTGLDTSAAAEADGVEGVITAKDLPPGSSNSCCFVPGQLTVFVPIGGDIITTGQQLALVVAKSYRQAKAAAALVKVTIEGKNVGAITTLEQAIACDSKLGELLGCPVTEYALGDVEAALEGADRVIEGETHVIGQHAFPMEKQSSIAIPEDQQSMIIYSSTQAADLCRHTVAGVLGLEGRGAHVVVRQNRAGGAFGAKSSRNIPIACAAAVAANALEKPVRVQLEATQEQASVGGRHPVKVSYKVGFKPDGTIQGCFIESWLQGGCTHDFTGMLIIEYSEALASVYQWGGNFKVTSHAMKTNTSSHTAVRSFGNPQAQFVTETILEKVAAAVGKSVEEVREINMMKKEDAACPWGQPLVDFLAPELWAKMKVDCKFEERSRAVEAFNREHRWRKRGISMVPLIYGLSYVYTSGTGALVNIHGGWLGSGRGGVTVFHGGCEIGQGVHTKVAQVVAMTLGCPLEKVRVGETSTEVVPNQRFTGGSTTSEVACEAARKACVELVEKLAPHKEALKAKNDGKDPTWEELIGAANHWVFGCDEKLSAVGISTGKSNKYVKEVGGESAGGKWHGDYFSYGAGCSEVELDVLTGERVVLRSDVLYDVGFSINPGIDLGQVEGAFAWGIGYYLTEEPLYDNKGVERSQGTWEYKPPMATEMPIEFNAELVKDNPFKDGMLSSKAVGEPPFMLAYSVLGAVKKAVISARIDAGVSAAFDLPMPCTVDAVKMACATSADQFKC